MKTRDSEELSKTIPSKFSRVALKICTALKTKNCPRRSSKTQLSERLKKQASGVVVGGNEKVDAGDK